jgi:hypothetical protein
MSVEVLELETPYGAKIKEFISKEKGFKLKAHVFKGSGEISYQILKGNTLKKFDTFKDMKKWKNSVSSELNQLLKTKKFLEEIEKNLHNL